MFEKIFKINAKNIDIISYTHIAHFLKTSCLSIYV
jgi:hypothetical protein